MIGLLPAAGRATRIGGLPKWLLPVPEGSLLALHVQRMTDAGTAKVAIGAGYHNSGLILQYAPAGTETYFVTSKTMNETVLKARRIAGDQPVLLGMPDTYWRAADVYTRLAQASVGSILATVAVWRIRPDQRGRVGQCAINPIGRVVRMADKDADCAYPWVWGALIFQPGLWDYIKPEHPHVGYAVNAAVEAGECIMSEQIAGDYYDCGTSAEYFKLCATFTEAVQR